MKWVKTAIGAVIAIAMLTPIIITINSITKGNDSKFIEFEIVDIDTNTVNVTDQYISNEINNNPINVYTGLSINDNTITSTLNKIILNDYQLKQDDVIPPDLPLTHLYFKYHEDDIYAIDNDPYQIQIGYDTVPEPDPITDLTGYTWTGNNTIDLSPDTSFSLNFEYTWSSTQRLGTSIELKQMDGEVVYWYDGDSQQDLVYAGSWGSSGIKTIHILGGSDATNTSVITWLQANGTLTPPPPTPVPVYDTPTLVYDVTPLINAKVYSPIFETTLDQMDNNQILTQMTEWYEQDVTFYQVLENTDPLIQIYGTGEINFISDQFNDNDIIKLNYGTSTQRTGLWVTLLSFIPLIYISGILTLMYYNKQKET